MAFIARLIFACLSFLFLSPAYAQLMNEGDPGFIVYCDTATMQVLAGGSIVKTVILQPGYQRCTEHSYGSDPAPGQAKQCNVTGVKTEAQCAAPPDPPPECSENQELDTETNSCVCKTGPAGDFAVSGDVLTGCNDGCTIVLNSGSYSSTANKTYGSWRQNGNTCSPSPELPGVDSPDSPDGQDAGKCPTGQCPGTFNGQFMCVPCKGKGSSDTSSSENTTETPNGASAPSSSASQSQSGSKSTECDGGVCTTKETVVTRNPDGSTTEQQKETTESISDYCAKNPKAAICKTEDAGQWGGACAGGFQCKGDAVQCAQAQAAWKAACLLDVASDDPNVVKGGQAMSSDQSALRAQLGLDGNGEDFNLSSMIDSDPLFAAGGGCPADQQVTLLGQSLTLSLSAWCSWLQTAGAILQAAAYLAAALIVFRRG